MSKKKQKRGRDGNHKPLRKALSSALLAGAVLVPTASASGKEQARDLTVPQRVTMIREAIKNRLARNNTNLDQILRKVSYEESEIMQWVNWGNWGNWGNWNNWNNWGNWGNWYNQWGNWGNF